MPNGAEVAFQISSGEKREGQPLGVPWNVLADDLGESLNLAKPQFPPGMIILSLKNLSEDARQVSTHSGDDGIAGGLNEVILIRNMVQRGIWSIHVSCYSCGCWKRWALDSWPQPKNHK